MAAYECPLGEAFLIVDEAYSHLKSHMIAYASEFNPVRYLKSRKNAGYTAEKFFICPVTDWMLHSYDPIQNNPNHMKTIYKDNEAAQNVITMLQFEIDLYHPRHDEYSYVFFVMKKRTGENHMIIRQETEKDYDSVYQLITEAFATAEHSDGTEQDLVTALRHSESFIPELSLVAEVKEKLAGHILFTKAAVGDKTVLVLAPLSVSPEFQKQGIGTALMKKGHEIAAEAGYPYVLVLGSEHYYPRMGYLPAAQFGIQVPDGIPSANFMAIRLQDDAGHINGAVTYAREFGL